MRRALPFLLALACLTGCVTLPESGPVRTDSSRQGAQRSGTFDYNPEGPRVGDQPRAIVNGFLDALRETPLTFAAAREFLTTEAAQRWRPNQQTIVYDDGALDTTLDGTTATVRLEESIQLDARGTWLGDPTGGVGVEFEVHLGREGDEWRITDPPDALIVSRSHFDTRFVRYDLHYVDPAGKVLVPEPVYLPAGDEAANLLVSGLLAGPAPALRSVERTFFPPGTRLELGVTLDGGVAEVPLSDDFLDIDGPQLELALAQLAWTLQQLPGVDQMRVTVGGSPVGSRGVRRLSAWSSYDPAGRATRPDLFAFRDGDVVSIADGQESLLTTDFRALAMRSLAVAVDPDSNGLRLGAVSQNGRRVYDTVVPSVAEVAPQVYTGTDVLTPAYDVYGQTWLVDRTAEGARVVVLLRNGRQLSLILPGISGADVRSFQLSRDGSRLAAVVGETVVIARVARTETGRPISAQPAVAVPLEEQLPGRPVDLAWATPSTIGVLVRVAPALSQVLFASVDGSFAAASAVSTIEPLFERATSLVTRPGAQAPVLLVTRTGIYAVSASGHWTLSSLSPGLVAPTYAD